MKKNSVIDNMRLDGGIICLDFVNTIPDRVDGSNRDNLGSFEDLIYWSKKALIIDAGSSQYLKKAGDANNRKADSVFREAIDLRSLIYSIFHAISAGRRVKGNDLKALNKLVARYFQFLELKPSKDAFTEQWAFQPDDFDVIAASLVKSTRDLLLSDKLERIKECPNCGWLFLDTTKNGKRRWCSMQDCGSKVKAREYYHRNKN